jgi:hypothetical protein
MLSFEVKTMAKHDDIKEDKALIKQTVKKSALKGMKKGGVTSLEMKKFGRNLARAKNQMSSKSSRGR